MWTTLIAAIKEVIRTNGNQEITGQLLQDVLVNVTSSVGENATFVDVAVPGTNPGTPDGPVFYIASTEGIYPNFGGLVLDEADMAVFKWNGKDTWSKHVFSKKGSAGCSNLTGYVSVASEDLLPSDPKPEQKTLGYLIGTDLYVFVGKNGDTAGGLYKNCGPFRGPKGEGAKEVEIGPDEPTEESVMIWCDEDEVQPQPADAKDYNNLLNKPKINGHTLTGDISADALGISSSATPIINHGTKDTTFSIQPNVLHLWGTISSLNVTLSAPSDPLVVSEYMLQFTAATEWTALKMPEGIKWLGGNVLKVESGKTYHISILNNLAVGGGF